jgi:hypothetical protein
MTTLADTAGEQIRAADARLAVLANRERHLQDEMRLADFRGDLDRMANLRQAMKQVGEEAAALRRERAKWVNALATGSHPVSVWRG